jgi:ATP-dependent DNA helicase RecG
VIEQSCDTLSGVGPALVEKLAKRGIHSVVDLLFHLPYKYQDRTHITPIIDVRHQDWSVIEGVITKSEITFGKRRSLQCYIEDKTGFLKARFFHFNKNQQKKLAAGMRIRLFGQARHFNGLMEIIHPEYQFIEQENPLAIDETLTPIYSAISGLSQTRIRQLINQALALLNKYQENIELIPPEILAPYNFPTLIEAINFLHNPPPDAPIQCILEGTHPSQKRLALEELLTNYLSLRQARAQVKNLKAPILKDEQLPARLIASLPFKLTHAQTRVIEQISHDLNQHHPMQRLVQGDVASGKTIVAAISALQAIESGYQVALMAPTEILAEQHVGNFNQWFEPLGLKTVRLTGSQTTKEKRLSLEALQSNDSHIAIGTHALFQDSINFNNLGLIIIDEQHRFGVGQRLSLQQKGVTDDITPHQLIMTATPIPRTLAMTNYADLDISIIDELPPGRTPIQTAVIGNHKRDDVIERLAFAIEQKKQVYWVCTLIEESEKLQCMAAEKTAQTLKELLPNFTIGHEPI